jgi:hypothetical protein
MALRHRAKARGAAHTGAGAAEGGVEATPAVALKVRPGRRAARGRGKKRAV